MESLIQYYLNVSPAMAVFTVIVYIIFNLESVLEPIVRVHPPDNDDDDDVIGKTTISHPVSNVMLLIVKCAVVLVIGRFVWPLVVLSIVLPVIFGWRR